MDERQMSERWRIEESKKKESFKMNDNQVVDKRKCGVARKLTT